MKKSKLLMMLGGAVIATIGAACSGNQGKAVKIGLICVHDSSSTYDKNFIDAMNETAAKLKARLGADPIIKTGIAEDESCRQAALDLIDAGCNVIIADSFGHEPFILDVAKDNPEVTFCHATGTKAKTAGVKNFHNAFASIYEGRYLAGVAAGLKLEKMIAAGTASKDTNGKYRLGYVGAFPYAEVVSGYTSWFLGVKSVVQDVAMEVTFTSEWYSPAKEQAGAAALIQRGAVIVSQHADSMGAPGECELRGVPNVTYNVPTQTDCPNTFLAYSKINWSPYYEALINAVYEGKAIEGEVNNNWSGTLGTGSVVYGITTKEGVFTEADKAKLEEVKGKIANKTLRVFDNSKFTVGGKTVTSYKADVDDDGSYSHETEAMVTEGDVTFFNESALRSAPYFDLDIDGITKLN